MYLCIYFLPIEMFPSGGRTEAPNTEEVNETCQAQEVKLQGLRFTEPGVLLEPSPQWMVDVPPCSSALGEACLITPAPKKIRLPRVAVARKSPVDMYGLGRQFLPLCLHWSCPHSLLIAAFLSLSSPCLWPLRLGLCL